MNRNILVFSITFFLMTFFLPRSAHAYLDPGTGSLILQIIIGVVIAVGATVKFYWYRITKVFRNRKK